MKRPPGLWLVLTIVAVWLRVDDVHSLKATALLFAKTTTTTTPVPNPADSASDEGATETSNVETETQNSSKPLLTGIPQIDYVWDPNLPRELNGYNLSEYPFYDRVPVNISFKCDGLHDGFYASVPDKCQVYHHCLYGVRYDFLCANYTVFDQKTFICHFASEVDCANSKKFWHRNDALYKATTAKPTPPTPAYTPPPVQVTTPISLAPGLPGRPERPAMRPRLRPPYRRQRPYDYYDDDYEQDYYEKPRPRARPKYRPRVYEDEYDYEEDEYSRPGRRRRPYKSRTQNRRRPYEDEEYEDEDSRRSDNRRKPDESRAPAKRRPMEDDDYDRRTYERPRKKVYRRPVDDDYEEDPPPRRNSERRKIKNRDEERKYEDEEEEEERPRKSNNRNDRPRKNYDRNRNEDPESGEKPRSKNERGKTDDSLNDDRLRKNDNKREELPYDDRPLPKPPSSIYERTRPVSKVRPPVPAHEVAKYSPKVPKTTTPPPLDDEEYYDEYEEDIKRKEEPRRSKDDSNRKIPTQNTSKRGFENKRKQEEDYEVADETETTTKRLTRRPSRPIEESSNNRDRRINVNSRRRPLLEDDEYDDYKESNPEKKVYEEITTTTTTKEPPREPIVKVVKRPFLPSRGGSPYTPRGLLPVGSKALDASNSDQNSTQEKSIENEEEDSEEAKKEELKPAPIVKIPIRNNNKYDEEFRPVSNRPATRVFKIITTTTTTTTERPRPVDKNPLDIDESEYDVTLNDALNPTLPNLPVRNFPTGFSPQNDYTYNTLPRSRYVVDPVINQASSDYIYKIEQPEQISNNLRYKAPNVPVLPNYRQNPRVTQAYFAPY